MVFGARAVLQIGARQRQRSAANTSAARARRRSVGGVAANSSSRSPTARPARRRDEAAEQPRREPGRLGTSGESCAPRMFQAERQAFMHPPQRVQRIAAGSARPDGPDRCSSAAAVRLGPPPARRSATRRSPWLRGDRASRRARRGRWSAPRVVQLLQNGRSVGVVAGLQDGQQDQQLEFAEGRAVGHGRHAYYVSIRRGRAGNGWRRPGSDPNRGILTRPLGSDPRRENLTRLP